MRDDQPIPLVEACKLFPRAKLTVSTLRVERDRGRLTTFKMGRREYTTKRDMEELVRRCREEGYRRDCISMTPEASGSSEMERVSSAQAALSTTVTALKHGLPRISAKSTPHNGGRRL